MPKGESNNKPSMAQLLPLPLREKLENEPEFQKVVAELASLPQSDIPTVAALMEKYRLNINQSFELCQTLRELLLKDNDFNISGLAKLELEGAKQSEAFMLALRAIRYPQYSEMKAKLKKYLSQLNSKNIKFNYKDNFESLTLDLVANIRNPEDIELLSQTLINKKEVISQLLSLIKNGLDD